MKKLFYAIIAIMAMIFGTVIFNAYSCDEVLDKDDDDKRD